MEQLSEPFRLIRVIYTLLFLFATYLMVGCSSDKIYVDKEVEEVLLVYLGGDNDLSSESQAKLEAITVGWEESFTQKVLIYQDILAFAPTLLEVGGDFVESYKEENSADAQVFARVLRKTKALYPGARFNLLVFSHASGWLPPGYYTAPTTRSIIADGVSEMAMKDFANAIPDGMFDCIYFEACFMTGVEVAYELRAKARYVAGSSAEIVAPGFTSLYQANLSLLFGDHPQEFMQAAYCYFDAQYGYLKSATFSILDTRKLDALASYIQLHSDFSCEVALDDLQGFDRYAQNLFFDFEDYYSNLLRPDKHKQELSRLIEEVVVWKASTSSFMLDYGGFFINRHSGLTAYIPQPSLIWLNKQYESTAWARSIGLYN